MPGPATAAPGDLDQTFSRDGHVASLFPGGLTSEITDAAIQPDGKIVAVGRAFPHPGASTSDIALARYERDGALDPSFSDDGLETIHVGDFASAEGAALQSDGKLVVGGRMTQGDETSAVLIRLSADGSLDPSFDGDGIVTLDLPTGESNLTEGINDVATLPDGAIFASGSSTRGAFVGRLLPDGRPDGTFSDDGYNFGPAWSFQEISVSADGSVLAAGNGIALVLVRFSRWGERDGSFGQDGLASFHWYWTSEGATSVERSEDGHILIAGYSCGGLHPACTTLVLRYRPDGTQDLEYGADRGVAAHGSYQPPSGALAVLEGGDAVLVGNLAEYTSYGPYALFSFNESGELDRRFARVGRRRGPAPKPFRGPAAAGALLRYSADAVIVAGSGREKRRDPDSFALARYELDHEPRDTDADGVRDRRDECPQEFGTRKNGCRPGHGAG
jgi:uncharacterized delta-60 repeat protein